MKKNMKKSICMILIVAMLAVSVTACNNATKESKDEIVLLSGYFTEIEILMQMAGILIEENTDLKVKFHDSMNTVPASQANESGEIDLFVSYDGTMLTTLLGYDVSDVPEGEDLLEWVRAKSIEKLGLTLMEPFGFENTYALAVREDFANENNIQSISDLAQYTTDLVFGAEHEFFDEEASMRFKPLNKQYGLEWKDSKSIDIGLKYAAMDSGNIDATIAYSTDGLVKKSNLKVLEDDKSFFPQYFAAYQVRDSLFEEFADSAPNLEEELNKLAGKIDNVSMTELNYLVDVEGQDAYDVAKAYLVKIGLSK
ncbi:osmoprotectant transport system substrate-binding protein/osmoprotectant transport system permease protein [Sedimentibacter acidaminivorans]|uniref:Osmoprotectant transport system substrate-binding protein/osmoprotectant transport system permease protein n=1 Tax=Sedimentibacter acidaminivorans TaxID=913099 RepID=A0ABS4GBT5_9FIRM|nr:glycine betaine ABC transporter substrate-binding protein [Sedimentibacter acidaminivorans]MBP1925144.1 osmoprotectant transport system substrate-binding protein/osmoprotectant transport system permease protein [Sedimentibacter acidaminivorans]